jgi:hypothetical protein
MHMERIAGATTKTNLRSFMIPPLRMEARAPLITIAAAENRFLPLVMREIVPEVGIIS